MCFLNKVDLIWYKSTGCDSKIQFNKSICISESTKRTNILTSVFQSLLLLFYCFVWRHFFLAVAGLLLLQNISAWTCFSEYSSGHINIYGERHRSRPGHRWQRSLLFSAAFLLLCYWRSPRHRHCHQRSGLWDDHSIPANCQRHGEHTSAALCAVANNSQIMTCASTVLLLGSRQSETSIPAGKLGNRHHWHSGYGPYIHQFALQHQHRGECSPGQ